VYLVTLGYSVGSSRGFGASGEERQPLSDEQQN